MRKLANEELHRLSVQAYKEAEKIPIIVILDNIRSLNNIGSVFRTADAFRIEKIYLCGITACPPHKEISVRVFAMKRETDLTSIYVQTRSATGRRRTRSDGGPVVELDQQDRP